MAKHSYTVHLGKERLWLHMEPSRYNQRHTWQTMRHCHSNYELHILLGGSCRVAVNDRLLDVQAGQLLLIPPGEYHFPAGTKGDLLRFSLCFAPETAMLQQALQQALPRSRVLMLPAELSQLCQDIFREFAAGNLFKDTLLQAQLTSLIVQLLRLMALQVAPAETAEARSDARFVDLIDNYFEKHFTEPAGEEKLAKELNLSQRQLTRILQKYYGMGYRQKLIRARMDQAAWLLRTTSLSVSSIASQVGYTSDSAFFQVFRQHFGMTPTRYRKQLREN